MSVRPRNVRHREYEKLRHSHHLEKWLDDQASRLGITAKEVFDTLLGSQGLTYEQVENLPDAEPEEPEGP